MAEPAPDLGTGIARVAEREGDRLAISDGREELTYAELAAAARGLAATLPSDGGAPRPLALLLPHAPRTVVAMLAALLAGRAPCVISPAQPRRRVEALLEALAPEAVWVEEPTLRRRLRAVGIGAVSSVPPASGGGPAGPPAPAAGPGDVCAIYLTSGSSGAPKPVGYAHGATRHRAELYATAIDATPADRFSLVSPLWTAASASALFTALLRGASLHLLDPARTAPTQLGERVGASGITVWHSTPSLFRRLVGSGAMDRNRFRAIRLGGEPLLRSDVELVREVCTESATLVAGYSLTEANGAVTQRTLRPGEAGVDAHIDAGPPLEGVEVRVEREDGTACPAGEEGEIVVGGLLSAGYIGDGGDEDGTRFAEAGGATVLRTGDRGVLHPDGSLEIRGRSDRRVKIRGHRVDPVEVEAAALRHPAILDAAAAPFARNAGGKALALYVVPDSAEDAPTPASLRDRLQETLAREATPAVVEVLDELPLTAAGKVDRGELARRASSARGGRGRGRPDPVAVHLARLWREALEVDDPGPEEDFFALGGDSLAAAEVCAGIESIYGLPLEPAVLLRHRTVTGLAAHVRGALDGGIERADPVLHLNPGGSRQPLFTVPGAGSEATALVHFAEAVGPDQPVNVIQLPGADGRSRPLTRMEAIAEHCSNAIRSSHVQGPYLVAGTSFGGLVAYAVASRLLEEGDEVSYLGLFDAPAPSTRPHGYLAEPLRRFRPPPNMTARGLARHPRAELRRLRPRLREPLLGYRLSLSLLFGSDWQPPVELRFRYLRLACSIAATRWTPPSLSTGVHLYRCDAQPPHLEPLPTLGWERHASDIVVTPLPTRHGRHIRSPGVTHLAAAVTADLDRARERDPIAAP